MATHIKNPDLSEILGSVLPSLPPAAIATQPSESVLAYLAPILKQRVQVLSSSSTEPWIRLLCYDSEKAAKLAEVAQSDRLEPHPVSGEIEVDWDYDAETRYRRLDEETLQALVVLQEKGLSFRLVYCTGEADGWKVGEVSTLDSPSPFSSFGGASSIAEADRQFQEEQSKKKESATTSKNSFPNGGDLVEEEDDDDDYWARYDATPARTPATKRSPAPPSTSGRGGTGDEDDYYAQYDTVQPAMDPHDPDEEVNMQDMSPPPLGLAAPRPLQPAAHSSSEEEAELNETHGAWTIAEPPRSPSAGSRSGDDPNLAHPRPASSAGSNSSVAKLEAAAKNFGVQQHISRSIKSLFMLARASGMDREDFDGIVKRELEMLRLMED